VLVMVLVAIDDSFDVPRDVSLRRSVVVTYIHANPRSSLGDTRSYKSISSLS